MACTKINHSVKIHFWQCSKPESCRYKFPLWFPSFHSFVLHSFIHSFIHSFTHSFIHYAFIKSIQGLAPSRYRTCHCIIQKNNTNINITVISFLFHHILTIINLQHLYITFLTHTAETNHKLKAILHTHDPSILKSLIFREFTN